MTSEANYRKEQAAAKLLEFFKAYELLTTHYAEVLMLYPDAAVELEKAVPGLSEIKKAGEDIVARIKNNNE